MEILSSKDIKVIEKQMLQLGFKDPAGIINSAVEIQALFATDAKICHMVHHLFLTHLED